MFKELAAVAMMAILGAPPLKTGIGTRYYDGLPPAKYIKEGAAVVMFIHPTKMNDACGVSDPPPGLVLVACVRRLKNGTPVIFSPHPCLYANETYGRIMCHEGSHAFGNWPGDHPA